jgi:hypothetical protein
MRIRNGIGLITAILDLRIIAKSISSDESHSREQRTLAIVVLDSGEIGHFVFKCPTMSDNKPIFPFTDAQVIDSMRAEIEKAEASGTKRPIEKFVLAALSSIPWIGSFLSAAASLRSEEETNQLNYLQMLWVEEHQRKLIELARLLEEIRSRFESLGISGNRWQQHAQMCS